jgi:hypothetical protein
VLKLYGIDYFLKKVENTSTWDWAECEELGIISEKHWKKFIDFLVN